MRDLDEIYFKARELPPQSRSEYLAAVCGENQALRERVEQMLAISDEAEAFIVDLPDSAPGGQRAGDNPGLAPKIEPASLPDPIVGQMIGRYKILERIGEGGFGVVYVADQTEPMQRRVALKVIKLGMDTKAVVARFGAERQALAMMDHPNIAKVHDAGTTETGRPYFVMELVRGIRITDYCDEAKLNTHDRLDLFIKVCQAIQHAHQKGIIHRDIKPSNILVTLHDGVPVPKVIDFGIAKAIPQLRERLTDATVYTQLHQFIGTPAYMSPEQAEMSGLDIDTRSDIYSLGVLLYELLSGCTPFDAQELMASGIDAMRRTIREQEPKRPSTRLAALGLDHLTTAAKRRSMDATRLLRQLIGDLDWIVMKCLEKDRTRRYETANELANDLKRHLSNEPVVARPPSAAYRMQKAFRRNKPAFIAVFAVGLALLVGTIISTWQAVEATRARRDEHKQRVAAQQAEAHSSAQQKKAETEKQRAEEQLARAEQLVYASKLRLAQTDFEAGNGGLALHYLDECQRNLRGWEHRYLSTRIDAKQTLAGHTREVSSVAYSPDGQRIVTGSQDGTAKVWDVATGQELLTLKGHQGLVLSVVFSADGQRILTGGGEWGTGEKPGEAMVWDAETGRLLLALRGHSYCVWSAALSPDGQRVVTGAGDWAEGPGEAKVWNARTGEEILDLDDRARGVRAVAFSPDGTRIVTGGEDHTAKVWDALSGRQLLRLKTHQSSVRSVAFSPDGQRVVTGSWDNTAKIWDGTTGKELFVLKGHGGPVRSVAFSPNGKRLVTGSADQTLKVWSATWGNELLTLKGHGGPVRGVAFSPDGKRIVAGSNDKTARIWDAVAGQEIPTLKAHTDFIADIAFSPDGKRIVTGSGDGTARIWDTSTRREMRTLKGTLGKNREDPPVHFESAVWSVAFSPDGQRIVTGSNDKKARIWDVVSGQEILVLEHSDAVSSVAFSPDGKRIVTSVGEWGRPATDRGEIKLWNSVTGEELFALQFKHSVRDAAFSPDGRRIVIGSADATAKVLDATSGREVLVLRHTNVVSCVVFSPDGQRILTGSWDQTARVWDATSGQQLLVLKEHTSSVRAVVFSPDGQRIVTGGDDRMARVWDATTGQELLSLKNSDAVWSLAFSPDGTRVVTGIAGGYATARIWSAAPSLDASPVQR